MAEEAPRGAVLGLDTATPLTAVAVSLGREVRFERTLDPGPRGRPRHATGLLATIEDAVSAAGGWERIATLAVGVGPGSFTGLRVGVATARALSQGLGKPLVPVSSLAAIAGAIGGLPDAAERPRLALIDARRGEVFAALHDADETVLWEPFVAPPETLAKRLDGLGARPLAAGDGSLRFRDELEAAGAEVPGDGDPVHRLSARQVCRLAGGGAPARPEAVEPMYLRRPDAEVWRERISDGSTERA